MIDNNRVAQIAITRRLIKDILNLPDGTLIRQIGYDFNTAAYIIEVTHENLPIIEDGAEIPRILPHLQLDTHRLLRWPDLGDKI